MRVLVTWGSKRGGTEGIGRIVADALETHGFEVVAVSAEKVDALDRFDAVIVGGALYANRWPANVRRFVKRNVRELRKVPVWFFSSGPLDDSAERQDIPPSIQVAVLAERVGARGHVTFGGRLAQDAKGFPARAMARSNAGDWRNPEHIREWVGELAAELPGAAPGAPVEHRARSVPRLLGHGLVGWALTALILLGSFAVASPTVAAVLRTVMAPALFAPVAHRYFHARGPRDALPTAIAWAALMAVLDLVVAAAGLGSFAIFASIAATWLPYLLVFLVTWGIGALMSTLPWTEVGAEPARPATTET